MESIRMPAAYVYGDRLREHARWETNSNRYDLAESYVCGCAACGQIFFPEEIRRYEQHTALCPFCGKQTVIGDATHLPIIPGFLRIVKGDG